MNPFFDAQFNYCPLIWMVHSRTNNIIWLDIFMRDTLMNFWGGIIQLLYIIEIYKVWQLRSLKLSMKCLQKLLVIFLRKELIPLHEKRSDTKVFLVRIQENTDQKKLLIWPLFAECTCYIPWNTNGFRIFLLNSVQDGT